MFVTRLYALILLIGILVIAAGELIPRGELGALSRPDLVRRLDKREIELAELRVRAGADLDRPGDDMRTAVLRKEVAEHLRERRIRDAMSAGTVLALALVSGVFALVAVPRVRRDRRHIVRGGDVEVEPDQQRPIDALDAGNELATLFHDRRAAIAHLFAQPVLRCEHCRTRWEPAVLGRIGKRVLVRRGSPQPEPLGEGWWVRPADPPPCVKCGSNDLVPT